MFTNQNSRQRGKKTFAETTVASIRKRTSAAIAAATLCLLGSGLLGTDTAQANTVAVIRNDPGGSIESRLQMIGRFRSAGTQVQIRGKCDSACTMFLGLSNTCVAPSSRLGFHGPQSQYYGISLPPEDFEYWSMVMADHYPGAIRSWFLAEARQTTLDVITISGSQAIKMGARPC